MTEQEIDEMEAGPKLDALIAEHVMGLKPPFAYADATAGGGHGDPGGYRIGPRPYSTTSEAALFVIGQMESRGYWCQMRTPFGPVGTVSYDGYWAGFTPHQTTGWNGKPDSWTNAHSLALAICRAALKSV